MNLVCDHQILQASLILPLTTTLTELLRPCLFSLQLTRKFSFLPQLLVMSTEQLPSSRDKHFRSLSGFSGYFIKISVSPFLPSLLHIFYKMGVFLLFLVICRFVCRGMINVKVTCGHVGFIMCNPRYFFGFAFAMVSAFAFAFAKLTVQCYVY